MKNIITLSFLLILVSTFTSCGTAPQKNTTNPFNPVTLNQTLIKGKTTQGEVLKTFGAPNVVAKGSEEFETWTYSRQNQSSQANEVDVYAQTGKFFDYTFSNYLGGSIGGGQTTRKSNSNSIDVTMTFKKGVLEEYNMMQTQY
ncbi:MAG: hypothetical protein EP319_05020 [Deltaproteobacteria bacterium]|nr:MAG: hypothetical protein EP319_05020 [Deltaproteobacteria bacterium]